MSQFDTLGWPNLLREFRREWAQGEHFGVVGPTGVGKTTLLSQVLPVRKNVVIFVTKQHDKVISNDFPGYVKIDRWPPPKAWNEKVLLWPTIGKKQTIRDLYRLQHDVFQEAMDKIFHELNWCCVFDEQHYLCQSLKLTAENTMFQHQGRSSGITVVNGSQRPAWVPLVTFSGSTHMCVWKNTHPEDLKRLSSIGGVDKRDLETNLRSLSKHEFIYINTRKGTSIRSQVER